MPIPPGAHARWLTRHLLTTVSATARRAGVPLDNLRRACLGEPKVIGAERMARVHSAHGLTAAQFAWNAKVGWHWKKSFAPRTRPIALNENTRGNIAGSETVAGATHWCRPDLCRLAGRCIAAKAGDFTGRLPQACLDTRAHKPSVPRVRRHTGFTGRQIRRSKPNRKLKGQR